MKSWRKEKDKKLNRGVVMLKKVKYHTCILLLFSTKRQRRGWRSQRGTYKKRNTGRSEQEKHSSGTLSRRQKTGCGSVARRQEQSEGYRCLAVY